MNIYEQDVLNQAKDVSAGYKLYLNYISQISELSKRSYRRVLLTGMGSSYSACMNAATILRNAGMLCDTQVTSQLIHYEMESVSDDDIVVIVSQSGRSAEIVELTEKLSKDVFVVGVTNDALSPLGKRSNLLLELYMESEVAVSTRNYIAPLLLMHMFAKSFIGAWDSDEQQRCADSLLNLEKALDSFYIMKDAIKAHIDVKDTLIFIARGYSCCTGDAGALFAKEVAKHPAIYLEAAQFRHGPFEMLGKGLTAFIFAPKDKCYSLMENLARQVAQKGTKVVFVTDSNVELSESEILVLRQHYASSELACISNIVPAQCVGSIIAESKDLKVGTFLFSSKVTTVQ
jgi:glucosamine--fructose-6-phosphate aminotransferase (isomerizing)